MRAIILALLCLWAVSFSEAQELWLRPDQYFYEPSQTAKVELLGGVDFIGDARPAKKDDVVSLSVVYAGKSTDIAGSFVSGDQPHFMSRVFGAGIYQFLMELKPGLTWMETSRFNEFIKQYDLEDIALRLDGKDSVRLSLRQFLKAYVRVGKDFDRSQEKPTGLPLEIIPDKNPLVLEKGEKITFTILKDGKPAFGTRVRIWNRWNRRTTIQQIYAQQDGTVSTTISSPGDWMVSVAEVKPPGEGQAHEGTIFTMTFGYR